METENGEDEIPPKANDFMNQLMSFMSAEMKWRKEDRKRDKMMKKSEQKRLQEEQKKKEESEVYRRTQEKLSSFPKISDKQLLDVAIESLESAFKHTNLPANSWNYALFTSLTGKFQELAADIPHSEDVQYHTFKRQLLEAAGYTKNLAGLQLWDNSYGLYYNLSPAQWIHRQKRLTLRIVDGSQKSG